jgi:hypothetical protein
MDFNIGKVTGTVHAVDGESLLSPHTLEQIVRAVLRALEDGQLHQRRAQSDTRVTAGIAYDQEHAK